MLTITETVDAINAYARVGSPSPVAVGSIDRMIDSQAVMLATNEVFLATSLVFVLSIGAILLVPKPAHSLKVGASH